MPNVRQCWTNPGQYIHVVAMACLGIYTSTVECIGYTRTGEKRCDIAIVHGQHGFRSHNRNCHVPYLPSSTVVITTPSIVRYGMVHLYAMFTPQF